MLKNQEISQVVLKLNYSMFSNFKYSTMLVVIFHKIEEYAEGIIYVLQ